MLCCTHNIIFAWSTKSSWSMSHRKYALAHATWDYHTHVYAWGVGMCRTDSTSWLRMCSVSACTSSFPYSPRIDMCKMTNIHAFCPAHRCLLERCW